VTLSECVNSRRGEVGGQVPEVREKLFDVAPISSTGEIPHLGRPAFQSPAAKTTGEIPHLGRPIFQSPAARSTGEIPQLGSARNSRRQGVNWGISPVDESLVQNVTHSVPVTCEHTSRLTGTVAASFCSHVHRGGEHTNRGARSPNSRGWKRLQPRHPLNFSAPVEKLISTVCHRRVDLHYSADNS
jgi:hypothetical protein